MPPHGRLGMLVALVAACLLLAPASALEPNAVGMAIIDPATVRPPCGSQSCWDGLGRRPQPRGCANWLGKAGAMAGAAELPVPAPPPRRLCIVPLHADRHAARDLGHHTCLRRSL